MKKILLFFLVEAYIGFQPLSAQVLRNDPLESIYAEDKLGDGLFRIQYTSVKNCLMEFQSFSPKFTEKALTQTMHILPYTGAKGQGLNNEFIMYGTCDYTGKMKDKKEYIKYSESKITESKKALERLKSQEVPAEAVNLKSKILQQYTDRLRFETSMFKWIKTNNDAVLRKELLEFYNDITVANTLDKTLKIEDWKDKIKYSHLELNSIFEAKFYKFDELIKAQNALLMDNKLKLAKDPECLKD